MKYKSLLLVALLMFVVLTGLFFYKARGIFYNIEDNILQYLENQYQINIEVKDTSFWPINQIILKDVKMGSQENDFFISAPEITIYYNFLKIIYSTTNPSEFIDLITLDRPFLEIRGKGKNLSPSNIELSNTDEMLNKWSNTIFSTSPFQIKVEDGVLSYIDEENRISLDSLNFLLKVIDKEESQIKLETGVNIENIKWNQEEFKNLKLNDLQITLSLTNDNWQGILETDYIDIKKFNDYLTIFSENIPLNISNLDGRIKPVIVLEGNKLSINNYNASLSLENIKGELCASNKGDLLSINQEGLEEFEYIKNELIGDSYLENGLFILQDVRGDINFDSKENTINIEEIGFILNGNLFKLSARLDTNTENPEIYGHLRSNDLDLMKFDLLPEDLILEGSMAVDFLVEGLLSNLNMNIDLSLAEGSINDNKLENLVGKVRYYQGNAYLDQLNFILGDTGQISMNGIYNNERYSFNIKGHDIDIELLNKIGLNGIENSERLATVEMTGGLNLAANITGKELNLDNLNVSGMLEFIEPSIYLSGTGSDNLDPGSRCKFTNIKSDFYISKERLSLQQGKLISDWGEIVLSGEIGIIDKDIELRIDSDAVNSAALSNAIAMGLNLDMNNVNLTGDLQLDGLIKGNIISPQVEIAVFSKEGSYNGIRYDNLSAKLDYFNKDLSIEDLSFNYRDTHIYGDGLIEISSEEPQIQGYVSSDNFNYKHIFGLFDIYEGIEGLPLEGNMVLTLSLTGPIAQPEIFISAKSNDTVLVLNNKEIAIDELGFDLVKQGDGFLLKEMVLTEGKAKLMAEGLISGEFLNLEYNLDSFSTHYLFDIESPVSELDGIANISGRISGSLKAPFIRTYINIQDLNYKETLLGSINGNIYYSGGLLDIDSLSWKNQEQEYIIDGEIRNLLLEPYIDISLSTERGQITDLAFLGLSEELETLFLENYYFTGQAQVRGQLDNIHTDLDFHLINNNNPEENVKLLGNIDKELSLFIEGKGIALDKFMNNYTNTSIAGELYFDGEMTGKIDSFDLFLNTRINNVLLEDFAIENIEGSVEVRDGSVLDLKQVMIISENSRLNFNASYPFMEGIDDLSLNLKMERFPLELISLYSPSIPPIFGILSGEIDLIGGFREPVLAGKLKLNEGKLDLDFPGKFSDLNGDITLSGQNINLNGLKGRYGDGPIRLQGQIRPFAGDNNFDIDIKGEDLLFDYGCIKGKFDGDGKLAGLFEEPYIEAELQAHDLSVGLPFEWPKSEGKSNWRYNLNIHPGTEVYLKNENIDVLIQEGSLNIHNLNGQLDISGELNSTQGIFDYYNNKFFLEDGSASFGRTFVETDRYIPEVNVNAWTNVRGTRIEVQLNGRANNMVATFISLPSLSQEEILNLLTSKGGLGEFTAGNFGDVIVSEFYRWLHNQIQLDFVTEIQETFKNIFELDRFELDTYNIGWNNQVSVYLGKNLNKRLYLEYTNIVGPENTDLLYNNEAELSLQYLLDKNIILEGSWLGDEDYSLGIETNIPF